MYIPKFATYIPKFEMKNPPRNKNIFQQEIKTFYPRNPFFLLKTKRPEKLRRPVGTFDCRGILSFQEGINLLGRLFSAGDSSHN
jgi:hypothetical protein